MGRRRATGRSGAAGIAAGAAVTGVVLWMKLLHLATLAMWSAGLVALPVLFSCFPRTEHAVEVRRLRAMTRYGFIVVVSPAAVLTIISGTALIYLRGVEGSWLMLKLTLVALMVAFHVLCGWMIGRLHDQPRLWPAARQLSLTLAPLAIVPTVFWLVLGKPA